MITRYVTRFVTSLGLLWALSSGTWADDYGDALTADMNGDTDRALALLVPLAEQGHIDAALYLGSLYHTGWGVPQDYKESVKWIRIAADAGDAGGQFFLGVAYELGEGISQDFVEALKWYRLSAEQGNANAQYRVGQMYALAQGVSENYEEAAKWFHASAAQGNTDAHSFLGAMYALGKGVPQDFVQAYLWLSLAADEGDEVAINNLALVTEVLTPSQTEEAQRLTREWMSDHPQ